jgi:hypothetical protein
MPAVIVVNPHLAIISISPSFSIFKYGFDGIMTNQIEIVVHTFTGSPLTNFIRTRCVLVPYHLVPYRTGQRHSRCFGILLPLTDLLTVLLYILITILSAQYVCLATANYAR